MSVGKAFFINLSLFAMTFVTVCLSSSYDFYFQLFMINVRYRL